MRVKGTPPLPEDPTTHRGPEHGLAELPPGRLTVAELLQREGGTEERVDSGRCLRISRMLASIAGTVLVCAVIIASTAALTAPRVERVLPATGALEHITGPGVLRPDLLNTTIDPTPAEQPSSTPSDTSPTAPEPTDERAHAGRSLPPEDAGARAGGPGGEGAGTAQPPDGDVPSSEQAQPSPEQAQPSPEPSPDTLLSTVSSFYQQAVTSPADAYALLAPVMRGSDYQAFAESWRDVEQVSVEGFRRDGPHAAIVTVVMQRADGSVLRSVQRVVVAGDPPRIESARLLSASTS